MAKGFLKIEIEIEDDNPGAAAIGELLGPLKYQIVDDITSVLNESRDAGEISTFAIWTSMHR